MWLDGFGELKNLMTSMGIKRATSRMAAQRLNKER
jgi:hypothetical protein